MYPYLFLSPSAIRILVFYCTICKKKLYLSSLYLLCLYLNNKIRRPSFCCADEIAFMLCETHSCVLTLVVKSCQGGVIHIYVKVKKKFSK